MPKTKSKPVAKKSTKGNASKQSKKKSGSSTPLLKDQGEAFEEGIAAAALPPRTAKKRTAKATLEPAPAPHAVTSETTPAVVVPDVTSSEATAPVEAPPHVVETSARGAIEETGSEASPAGAPSASEPAEPRMPPVGTVLRKCDLMCSGQQCAEPDPRIPPVGTVLRRQDRRGNVRCECVVEEDGVRYAGTVYRSLSAAAVAASKDLGLRTTSANGFSFWGLSKPARGGGRDPLKILDRAWTRLRTSLNGLLSDDQPEEARARVLAAVRERAQTLARLAQ